jgi:glycosyltransferase involved in cell wall biosynthesis
MMRLVDQRPQGPKLSSRVAALLPAGLRQKLSAIRAGAWRSAEARSSDPYRGNLEAINSEGLLTGWVFDRQSRRGRILVGLYAGEILLETGTAQFQREDVAAAHGCDATCGLRFAIGDRLVAKVLEYGGRLTVRTMSAEPFEIGAITLKIATSDPPVDGGDIGHLAHMLKKDLALFVEALKAVPETEQPPGPVQSPRLGPHQKMFQTEPVIPEIPLSGQPAYMDYVRYRYRKDEEFDVAPGHESADRFLYWYLTSYRSHEKRRIPLSREQIAYLNTPLVMGGQQYAISRAMWWRLVERPNLLGQLNLNSRDCFLDILFWWANTDCPYLYFEDCLVPDRFADHLRGVHPSRRLNAYPLSYFTERYVKETPALYKLDAGTAQGRKTLVLCMLLKAVQRPDLLRYIPSDQVTQLLGLGAEGPSPFEAFVNALLAATPEAEETPPAPLAIGPARYMHVLRARDFDLPSRRFLTVSPDGDRFEAVAMHSPEDCATRPAVDVQLIGPLAKASGLGQATRLSADILRATGLSLRCVDFDLDNPAPEGFSSDAQIDEYGPARINMIHLNAESTPLAFAYQPDVFSGRYNIGYFFWELDRPAYCHYLGMDLLDEIWVCSDYGAEIYSKDDHGKPVVNVGMCYEDIPGLTRAEGRAFVEGRFLFNAEHFVCLVAFDSFSFVQRKNPVTVLKAFQRAFEDVPEARLVIKTQNRDRVSDDVQVRIWDQVDTIVAADPRMVILNETLSYPDLLRLKVGSDCYLSLHKSEGWGFGMIEAMNLGVPVLATAYSGNMDFCSAETAWLVDYVETSLELGEYIFVRKGSRWAEPDVASAAAQLRALYDHPKERQAKALAAQDRVRAQFSRDAIAKRYGERLREILATLDDVTSRKA